MNLTPQKHILERMHEGDCIVNYDGKYFVSSLRDQSEISPVDMAVLRFADLVECVEVTHDVTFLGLSRLGKMTK